MRGWREGPGRACGILPSVPATDKKRMRLRPGHCPPPRRSDGAFRRLAPQGRGIIGLAWRPVPCEAANGTAAPRDWQALEQAVGERGAAEGQGAGCMLGGAGAGPWGSHRPPACAAAAPACRSAGRQPRRVCWRRAGRRLEEDGALLQHSRCPLPSTLPAALLRANCYQPGMASPSCRSCMTTPCRPLPLPPGARRRPAGDVHL